MLTPYIVNLASIDKEKRKSVISSMDMIGYTGVHIKPGTDYAYMFLEGTSSRDDVAATLSISAEGVTDATGWDMVAWSRG